MFKVPEWEKDIPESNVNFTKAALKHKRKNKKSNALEPKTHNGFMKQSFNARNDIKLESKLKVRENKFKCDDNISQHHVKSPEKSDIKAKKKKQKKSLIQNNSITDEELKKPDRSIVLNQYDTDKLDELILDAKKKKLNSPKNLDIEEALFIDDKEKHNKKEKRKKKEIEKNLTIEKHQNVERKQNVEKQQNVKRKQNIEKKQNFEKNPIIESKSKEETKSEKNNVLNGKVSKSKKKKNKLKKNIEESILKPGPIEISTQNTVDPTKSKEGHKKEMIKSLLQMQSHRNSINISNTSTLRERMLERLKAAKFRYLNEKLYTSSGADAKQLFQSDPEAFQTYHEGYQQQVKKWPVKPLDVIIQRIQKMPKSHTIADMGCGEGDLSRRVPNTVRSFDLVSGSPRVEACDMAHTPLLSASMDVVVYCLALMGTDLVQYLVEANRVLKVGGHLLIAEVESRFDNVEAFTKEVQKLGFSLKKLDKSHKVFFFMEFAKVREAPVKKAKLPTLTLKPCIYKKR